MLNESNYTLTSLPCAGRPTVSLPVCLTKPLHNNTVLDNRKCNLGSVWMNLFVGIWTLKVWYIIYNRYVCGQYQLSVNKALRIHYHWWVQVKAIFAQTSKVLTSTWSPAATIAGRLWSKASGLYEVETGQLPVVRRNAEPGWYWGSAEQYGHHVLDVSTSAAFYVHLRKV